MMTRVSANPGRDLSKPLVEIPADAPRHEKVVFYALRWYLVAIFLIGLLGLVIWTLLLVTGL
jgi:hypothetical protein